MTLEERQAKVNLLYQKKENLENAKRQINSDLNKIISEKTSCQNELKSITEKCMKMSPKLQAMDLYFDTKYVMDFFNYMETGVESYEYSTEDYDNTIKEYDELTQEKKDLLAHINSLETKIVMFSNTLRQFKEEIRVTENTISIECHHYELYDYADLVDWFKITAFHTVIGKNTEQTIIKQFSFCIATGEMFVLREDSTDRPVTDDVRKAIVNLIP